MDIPMMSLPQLPIDISNRFDPRIWEDLRGRFLPHLWWPCTIRILIVGDDIAGFQKGAGYNLGRVIEAIRLNLPHFVTIDIKTAFHHSSPGAGADFNSFNFAEHDLNQYDQIWFFAVARSPSAYNEGELSAIWNFMQSGGGVFATGDHDELVLRHIDFDGLDLVWGERWQIGWIDQDLECSCDAGAPRDESGLFELQHHLMNCGRRDFEEPYHIGLGGRTAVD